MKRIVLLLLLSTPLLAQSSLTFFGTSQRNGGGSRFPDATRDVLAAHDKLRLKENPAARTRRRRIAICTGG